MKLHHVQLAIPAGGEPDARGFWCDVLGFTELDKPEELAGRGGAWFRSRGGQVEIHVGVEADFRPAAKAHPALLVGDLAELASQLAAAGVTVHPDTPVVGLARFWVHDPFGNKVEFVSPAPAGTVTV